MSRCRACNAEMHGQAYYRTVTIETGEKVQVVEDLCRDCRSKLFQYSDPDDFDLIDGLGYDAEGSGHGFETTD